ncbi:DUF5821 family protein [Halobaculum sp. CBA1158]|uniref:transcriptional regulator TbsP domain-containing protein n=1 Tax=Halobaculum sp. CBA1158 TaxID=2904243 RepID=UPI001F391DC9|nr:DUF5821 family protein [Halobaculum sp. CBA1158]UIO99126.1 DUF5821 family protein [Halobaculum sp. CBA1158]
MSTRSPVTAAERAVAGDALVVAPGPTLARAVVGRLADRSTGGGDAASDAARDDATDRVRLLCSPDDAAEAVTDFLTATDAADAVADGRLAIRTETELDASLTIGDDAVWANVSFPSPNDDSDGSSVPDPASLTAVGDADGATRDAIAAAYDRRWREAQVFEVGTPARSTLLSTFRDRWPEAVETLAAVLDAADALPRDAVVGPVATCTLVAARHRLLTMELGEWTEEVGLSSRTEIARAKSRLIDAGLVDTEREPVGVGRPRHRLVPGDDRLESAPPADLLAIGRAALADAG